MGPSLMPSMVPSESVSPSQIPSDVPTSSIGPSMNPSSTPSISLGPTSTPVMILCFQSSSLSFAAHEVAANQFQGHVTSIHSAEENWLVLHITNNIPAWIGLVDYAVEGDFVWTDGSDVTFTSWYPDEPNSFNGRNEDCTTIR
eukprot:scaffold229260_cov71-Attheya_sp.AAC.1